MGSNDSKNISDKNNTLLNIFICNSDNQISEIKYVEEMSQKDPTKIKNYTKYKHKFYGWIFYDYGKGVSEGQINDIKNKIIKKAKK